MEIKTAIREALTEAPYSENEGPWRQSVVREALVSCHHAATLADELQAQGIETEMFDSILWVCYNRGGRQPTGELEPSTWGGFDFDAMGVLNPDQTAPAA